MQLLTDAVALLKQVDGFDGVWPAIIPGSALNDADHVQVLVTEVVTDHHDYGSGRSTAKTQTVAVNIYYGVNANVNADTAEKTAVSLFLENYWTVTYDPGHYMDPDTSALTKIFQFSRTIEE
jgi:hypothetical protein